MTEAKYTVGFANLDNRNPLAVRLHKGLMAADFAARNIDLIVRDNALDLEKAKANIDEFVNLPVDLAMVFHIDEREGGNLVIPLTRKNIPVISIIHSIPLTIHVGLDNKQAGQIVGEDLAKWVQANWNGQIDKVLALTNMRTVKPIVERIQGALDVLATQTNVDPDRILYVDDGGLPDYTRDRVQETLERWPDLRRVVMIALGDHIAVAALEAARELGREQDVLVGGMDGIHMHDEEFENPDSRLVYSLSFDAEAFGERLLELAAAILQGERVPRQHLMTLARPVD